MTDILDLVAFAVSTGLMLIGLGTVVTIAWVRR